ncbi:Protein NLRC3 [Paramyrothecium foliicola]|nr:Protein NLRC3 [Paramyrothecium foliicola]
MAAATQINTVLDDHGSVKLNISIPEQVDMSEVSRLASLCRQSLNGIAAHYPYFDHSKGYTADEILALPLSTHRVPDELYQLPRRRSRRQPEALALASLLYPVHEESLAAIIRYEADRVRLRGLAALQRRHDMLRKTKLNGHTAHGMTGGAPPGVSAPVWASRILAQGPWDPVQTPVSLDGVQAIPMPVKVAGGVELAPFLNHLKRGGTHELNGNQEGWDLDDGKGEPYYGVKAAEFRKGVVYEDGRMDLCKMVVGPDHIWRLMDSLRTNEFVQHFLLGNNIIGPVGAEAIARFVREYPERMDTWYLAGNCIDAPSLTVLVDALVTSPAVTNVWLKRNPLGPGAAHDIFRLITGTKNLRTLDLDQTELGNRGAADLFNELAAYTGPEGSKLPLRNIYLNGNGISTEAAAAIGSFLRSPHCGLTSLYMSMNPLGNEGAQALALALQEAPHLTRLSLQSVGVSTEGAVALCEALVAHPNLRMLDLGQAYATADLKQAYNYIEDGAVPAIAAVLRSSEHLEYLNLGHCAITPPGLVEVAGAVLEGPSLLYYTAFSILPDPHRAPATFKPSTELPVPDDGARTKREIEADRAVREHLESHIRARHGPSMTYARFVEDEKRWLVNDREVRNIDSVYRNRDAGQARRGLMTLVKDWDDDDDTLQQVRMAQGPVCMLQRAVRV